TFAKGKCACKALQYMAVGSPVVIAPVGMNNELLANGDNGILAANDDAWIEAVERLVDDSALADRMGLAGRRTVEEGYSAERSAERFAEMIRAGLERT
ncbi:MAG: glycosyltransferase, partial [Polyangia bacterium]